jgi:hypothetical protein
MQSLATRERDLEAVRTLMRLAFICTHKSTSTVIIGGGVRMFITIGGTAHYVFERLSDGVLRHAFFRYEIKQPNLTPDVECQQSEWDQFLDDALGLANRLGLPIQITERP